LAYKPLPAKTVTAKSLAQTINHVLTNPNYRENAQRISQQMQTHDGVGQAVRLLNKQINTIM
ncbi:hypothetical protein, partial [Methylomonas lenta]|uniref:hypothetical protein n=1 Tax=Methylomonas lenta TaxID=980561 RepID=UPI001E4220FD